MTVAAQMLDTYPKDLGGIDREKLRTCIDACTECAQACTACGDACLSEDMVAELTKCIRTCADCTDVCEATGRVLSRHTGYDANVTRAVTPSTGPWRPPTPAAERCGSASPGCSPPPPCRPSWWLCRGRSRCSGTPCTTSPTHSPRCRC